MKNKNYTGFIFISSLIFFCLTVFLVVILLISAEKNKNFETFLTNPFMATQRSHSSKTNSSKTFLQNDYAGLVANQYRLLGEGRQFLIKGEYEKAYEKYLESTKRRKYEHDKNLGYGGCIAALKLQQKYEEAMIFVKELNEAFPPGRGKGEFDIGYEMSHDEMKELEALAVARDTSSPQPVLDFIFYMKKKYGRLFYSKKFFEQEEGYWIAKDILFLYDHVGAVNEGLVFLDERLENGGYFFDSSTTKRRAKNLALRNAFVEDKKAGSKGRATQVLLEKFALFG